MPITREQPDHVFKTSDGRVFIDAQEAHCHERHIQISDAIYKYADEKKIHTTHTLALLSHAEWLAPTLALIVRATPLANA